ncbi:MAG: PRC-barrel domain-containing protein [Methanomassiliicoccaceae archaeon]|jgi:sporulation protein YlmC with PRC-barrel domain|nr:PRC-barrel domain-containing protein [Methanomassiliicoccaceae archaeon]
MTDSRVFISEIAGKMAVSKDGQLLGQIEDIVIDTTTGMVRYLILGPSTRISEMVDDMGRAVITVGNMQFDQDYIIITQ